MVSSTSNLPSQKNPGHHSLPSSLEDEFSNAFLNGNLEQIKYWINQDATFTPNKKADFLTYSAKYGNIDVVKYLIELGVDVNFNNDNAFSLSPLVQAAINNQVTMVKFLIEQGADVQANDNQVLDWAARYGDLTLFLFLYELSSPPSYRQYEVLKIAMQSQSFDIFSYFIKQGFDIHLDDNHFLKYSSEKGYLNFVQLLVEEGADIYASYDVSLTMSAQGNHFNVMQYLYEQYEDKQLALGIIISTDNTSAIEYIQKYINSKELAEKLTNTLNGKENNLDSITTHKKSKI